jgi:hypothetical protein
MNVGCLYDITLPLAIGNLHTFPLLLTKIAAMRLAGNSEAPAFDLPRYLAPPATRPPTEANAGIP